MNKPIIDHYGAYVTEPEEGTYCYSIHFAATDPEPYEVDFCPNINGQVAFNSGNLYATREAAEMALIRAKCLRRLKEMAYERGMPNDYDNTYTISILYALGGLGSPSKSRAGAPIQVYFKDYLSATVAYETITPEEKAAFLYVHNAEACDE